MFNHIDNLEAIAMCASNVIEYRLYWVNKRKNKGRNKNLDYMSKYLF